MLEWRDGERPPVHVYYACMLIAQPIFSLFMAARNAVNLDQQKAVCSSTWRDVTNERKSTKTVSDRRDNLYAFMSSMSCWRAAVLSNVPKHFAMHLNDHDQPLGR